ncbi:MAG: hypothetical protein QM758_09705 [Armatimonas sp.]
MVQQEQELHQQQLQEADRLIAEGDQYYDIQAFLAAEPFYSKALTLNRAHGSSCYLAKPGAFIRRPGKRGRSRRICGANMQAGIPHHLLIKNAILLE